MSPLHKAGDKEEPDNYRAITLGSCLGKLFNSILLERLIEFRKKVCPDSPNQLGFCAGSQTSDHIIVLKTILDKYLKRHKMRVYTCFVDYKKAFDTVCRQALLFKLSKLGIGGNFFNCIQYMYQKSTTKIKLMNKLSDAIDVEIGTEQGQPMSPELFKIFLHDLSNELDSLGISAPILSNKNVTHLLWADDLVLLALNKESLQKLLDCLDRYVQMWELEVNITKTNIMVFNTSGKILKESNNFNLGLLTLKSVKQYRYLGIIFTLNGAFKSAISNLVTKANRAFHQIKRTVDSSSLSVISLFNLFDSLILPILSYGSQVWIPNTSAGKLFESGNHNSNQIDVTGCYTKDMFEAFHIKYIKWVLGLHRKASNLASYGDCGRFPIAIKTIPQNIKYFQRLEIKANTESQSLAGCAFKEQRDLKLDWFKTWDIVSRSAMTPKLSKKLHASSFEEAWDSKRRTQSKLSFYNSVKDQYGFESYLNISDIRSRKALARIRSSAHDLRIETGRYCNKEQTIPSISSKACRSCCDIKAVEELQHLPGFETVIEDEKHVISTCPLYHQLRLALTDSLKCHIMLQQYSYIMSNPPLAKELGIYLHHCFRVRNPKKC